MQIPDNFGFSLYVVPLHVIVIIFRQRIFIVRLLSIDTQNSALQ